MEERTVDEFDLFDNISEKLKNTATVIFWIGTSVSVIIAIVMWIQSQDSYYTEELYTTLGFVFFFIGPIISWITSILFFGFGELIEKATAIERNTRATKSADKEAAINTSRQVDATYDLPEL